MRRFYEAVLAKAEEIVIWVRGKPMLSHINMGSGLDCTIRELAETIAQITGFKGKLVFDASKPDGTPRKLMDVSRLNALWLQAQTLLKEGLYLNYEWFVANQDQFRQS